MKTDPKLYLAVDNSFAKKRWTRPAEWMELLREFGVSVAEASADNELDPLYMDVSYMADWLAEAKREGERTGVRIGNIYSGHGTYATLGLAHTDKRNRDRFLNDWLKPISAFAAQAGAGLGFYCHAFSDATLQSPEAYDDAERDLYARLAELAIHCRDLGISAAGVEQMYTPHQIPWTIEGSKRLLREVYRQSGAPFYLTLDTGHQSGQRKFTRPSRDRIRQEAARKAQAASVQGIWLGPKSAELLFQEMLAKPESQWAAYLEAIDGEMDRYPHLFASFPDGDTYLWLEELGRYSPIVHLQQTDGTSSAHLPFTEEENRKGIVFGEPLLQALAVSYEREEAQGMPPPCKELYLTLEIFAGTSEMNANILYKMRESVRYWRQFIPHDGILLSEALRHLSGAGLTDASRG
ncbi:TIM barrel protein [Cohnella rhizosphaerae]|uniref:Sugar phosphate isomerase/epimerase n=1 Tax=Cohnella rhizosphaerae TaxID=1457232 RepID=A0A9X4L505_9BACL|nr:TIM barrel protein [Cohnella rhizosphaerae]MDG0813954.1 sugar phosphate isomerase/epimerase [Cohnella rhizosphaerae]